MPLINDRGKMIKKMSRWADYIIMRTPQEYKAAPRETKKQVDREVSDAFMSDLSITIKFMAICGLPLICMSVIWGVLSVVLSGDWVERYADRINSWLEGLRIVAAAVVVPAMYISLMAAMNKVYMKVLKKKLKEHGYNACCKCGYPMIGRHDEQWRCPECGAVNILGNGDRSAEE